MSIRALWENLTSDEGEPERVSMRLLALLVVLLATIVDVTPALGAFEYQFVRDGAYRFRATGDDLRLERWVESLGRYEEFRLLPVESERQLIDAALVDAHVSHSGKLYFLIAHRVGLYSMWSLRIDSDRKEAWITLSWTRTLEPPTGFGFLQGETTIIGGDEPVIVRPNNTLCKLPRGLQQHNVAAKNGAVFFYSSTRVSVADVDDQKCRSVHVSSKRYPAAVVDVESWHDGWLAVFADPDGQCFLMILNRDGDPTYRYPLPRASYLWTLVPGTGGIFAATPAADSPMFVYDGHALRRVEWAPPAEALEGSPVRKPLLSAGQIVVRAAVGNTISGERVRGLPIGFRTLIVTPREFAIAMAGGGAIFVVLVLAVLRRVSRA